MAKILVVRFSSIGDVVLTTPLLRLLKTQMDGEIVVHYLTKKKFVGLLKHNPNVDKVLSIEKDMREVKADLKAEQYDYIIDLHHNIRSATARAMSGGTDMVLNKQNLAKWLLIRTGINLLPDQHIALRYVSCASPLGIRDDGGGAEFYPAPDSDRLLREYDLRKMEYVAMAVGAAHEGKRMTPETIAGFCSVSALPVVLIGGAEDLDQAALVRDDRSVNLIGKSTIDESALVMASAAVVVTGDSGMMHIAAALGCKIVSIWGCTSPLLGMYPFRPHPYSVMLEPENRQSRPCSKLGNRCKYGMKQKCISSITADQIALVVNLINQKAL